MKYIPDLGCGLLRLFFGTVVTEKGFDPRIDARRIYFANHTSHLDFPLVWAALPSRLRHRTKPVAARDYWTTSALRRYLACEIFDAVLIDRSGAHGHANPLDPVHAALDAGSSVIIFPEGTRSMDGKIQEFKSGLFHLAKRHPESECVPVYLHNLNRIMPKGELLPVPLLSRVIFGGPMALSPDEPKEAFLTRARSTLEALAP